MRRSLFVHLLIRRSGKELRTAPNEIRDVHACSFHRLLWPSVHPFTRRITHFVCPSIRLSVRSVRVFRYKWLGMQRFDVIKYPPFPFDDCFLAPHWVSLMSQLCLKREKSLLRLTTDLLV